MTGKVDLIDATEDDIVNLHWVTGRERGPANKWRDAIPGVFFSLRLKNSRAKKLKLKNFLLKTQGFFVQKLKKSEILGTILAEKSKFAMKMEVFDEIS